MSEAILFAATDLKEREIEKIYNHRFQADFSCNRIIMIFILCRTVAFAGAIWENSLINITKVKNQKYQLE